MLFLLKFLSFCSLAGFLVCIINAASLFSESDARSSRTSGLSSNSGSGHLPRARPSHCDPFRMDFGSTTPFPDFERHFAPLNSPHSYELTPDGLNLYLDKPAAKVTTKGHVNSEIAEGSTFNYTYTVLYGKVTYTFSGPAVPGVVTAAILIAIAPERDEIDIELVGGDPKHWQTNTFAPPPLEKQPLYNAFSSIEDYPGGREEVQDIHSYTIDWNAERIIWSVDGHNMRTLYAAETKRDGVLHYPAHPTRLQFGIWDASSPIGTSEWAHGPIDWHTAPRRMVAVFKSIEVECPY